MSIKSTLKKTLLVTTSVVVLAVGVTFVGQVAKVVLKPAETVKMSKLFTAEDTLGHMSGNIFYLSGPIEDFPTKGYNQLRAAATTAKAEGKRVLLIIKSPGGRVDVMHEVISLLNEFDNIDTYVRGLTASAGAEIFMAGDKRFMDPGSDIVFHSMQMNGMNESDVEGVYVFAKKLENLSQKPTQEGITQLVSEVTLAQATTAAKMVMGPMGGKIAGLNPMEVSTLLEDIDNLKAKVVLAILPNARDFLQLTTLLHEMMVNGNQTIVDQAYAVHVEAMKVQGKSPIPLQEFIDTVYGGNRFDTITTYEEMVKLGLLTDDVKNLNLNDYM